MLLVTGIPTEIGPASTYDGFEGAVITHPLTVVHNAAELLKERPFGEFFQLPPSLVSVFEAAMKSKSPISFYAREQALTGGKKGAWIKRGVREVVIAEQLEISK